MFTREVLVNLQNVPIVRVSQDCLGRAAESLVVRALLLLADDDLQFVEECVAALVDGVADMNDDSARRAGINQEQLVVLRARAGAHRDSIRNQGEPPVKMTAYGTVLSALLDDHANVSVYSRASQGSFGSTRSITREKLLRYPAASLKAMCTVKLEAFACASRYKQTPKKFSVKAKIVGPPTVFRTKALQTKAPNAFDPSQIVDDEDGYASSGAE